MDLLWWAVGGLSGIVGILISVIWVNVNRRINLMESDIKELIKLINENNIVLAEVKSRIFKNDH